MKKIFFLIMALLFTVAGFSQTITDQATLDGTGSTDPDGSIVKYEWTQTSGATTAITNANNVKATVKFTTPGTYVYKLTVTDNQGATGSDQTTVTVLAANKPPVANIQSKSITIQLPK